MTDKSQTSPTMFSGQDASMAGSAAGFAASSSLAPHPAYLASPGPASGTNTSLSSTFAVPSTGWSSGNTIAPSWSNSTMGMSAMQASSGLAGVPVSTADLTASFSSFPNAGKAGGGMNPNAPNVVPLAADIGKNSIEGLAACLNTRDLTYWQDILGFDLGTPAV